MEDNMFIFSILFIFSIHITENINTERNQTLFSADGDLQALVAPWLSGLNPEEYCGQVRFLEPIKVQRHPIGDPGISTLGLWL